MRHFILAALLLGSVPASSAAPLAPPSGDVVLTVSGAIDFSGEDGTVKFDMAMLDALPQRVTTTETPWYDGARTFRGPLGSEILEAVGAFGTIVHVTAINDYSADIPIQDFMTNPVILATTIDGEYLSVRDKGPLFVIYPFDLDPDLYNEAIFGRSVWQVVSIEVR